MAGTGQKHFKELLGRVSRFEELLEFSQTLSSSLDYKSIQKKASSQMKQFFNCEAVHIYRYDDDKNELYFNYHIQGKNYNITHKVDNHSLPGSCAINSATIHVKDVKNDIRFHKTKDNFASINCHDFLLTPILHNGELYGVIKAINSNADSGFGDEDIQFIEILAGQFCLVLQNVVLFERYQEQTFQIIESLADAIGKKDSYTGGHTKRVSMFSEAIGVEMNLSFEEMNDLRLAARLHDIGKIGIPDNILKKDSPLDEAEFNVMREHPRLGYEILKNIKSLKTVTDGMRFHHERPDGKGYPYGLKKDEIPQIAQIISVADTFDAMISTRPYRKGLPPLVAYEEINKFAGKQFDETVVKAFNRYFKKSGMSKFKEEDFEENQGKKAG